jgi:hypothetical protein
MPKMLELIRQSAVPANVMRTAAKGALDLPAPEMLEVLVHLSKHQLFGDEARMTLASWEYKSALAVVSDTEAPTAVLTYFANPDHLRPDLFPALMDNPSVPDSAIAQMAEKGLRSTVEALIQHPRTHKSARILHALTKNENVRLSEIESLEKEMTQLSDSSTGQEDELVEAAIAAFHEKYADDIVAEGDRPFELFRYADEDSGPEVLEQTEPPAMPELLEASDPTPVTESQTQASSATPQPEEKLGVVPKEQREQRSTPFQRIARMTVGERVQLAMKGTKDERFILIRDGSKVVSAAVLESPKLTDSEVETFASMKNVQESVLRGIANKRKFVKLYPVIRSLVNNPRTPIDVALPFLNHLLLMDLRSLSINKNVGDLLRKMALRLFKDRSETKKQH